MKNNEYIMFDFGNVLARYVDPKENLDRNINNLVQGKCIEDGANYFNISSFYNEIINKEDYKKLNPKVAPYVLGEQILLKLKKLKVLNDEMILKSRIKGIELIDPEIFQKIEKYDSSVIPVIGSQNGQDAHDLFDNLFPEIERHRQIISTDLDINSRKDQILFYNNAANRLKTITQKIVLIDDEEKNNDVMLEAGGAAKLFNLATDNLEDTMLDAIETLKLVKRI